MNTGTTLILVGVLAVGASAATTVLFGTPSTNASEGRAAENTTPAALEPARVGALERKVELLTASVEALRGQLAAVPAVERVPVGEIQNAVDRWMTEHTAGQALQVASLTSKPGAAAPAGSGRTLDELLADLDRIETDEDWGRIWKEIGKNGLMDEAIALFESRVAADPNDPDLQVDVAGAYLAKTQQVGAGPEAGVWATKADKAYDRALELDENHWKARFSKATALSFWPPLFGKQGEAIHHFEILLEQQQSQPPQGSYAETHLFLGNLYQQTGKGEKALETWKNGLALYPDSKSLAEKLKALGQ